MVKKVFIGLLLTGSVLQSFSQSSLTSLALTGDKLTAVNLDMTLVDFKGKSSVRITGPQSDKDNQFVKVSNLDFKDGEIHLKIAGGPVKGADESIRGFVGVAFRIKDDNSKFECFFLRFTNGQADDQLRRNHTTQYIAYPDHPWYIMRKQFPGVYESYVDILPFEWTDIRIIVKGNKAMLYVNNSSQPVLIVNDLRHGPDAHGSVGFWVGDRSEGYFTDLRVSH